MLHDGSYVCLASMQYKMFFDVREAVNVPTALWVFMLRCTHNMRIADLTNRRTRLRNIDPTDARLCGDTVYCARLGCCCTTLTCATLPDLAVVFNIVFYPHSLSVE